MLTSSVNVVQSSFPEQDQGEISGLSRSVSNSGILAWDSPCRLGVGHVTGPGKSDLRPGHHYDGRHSMHWPDRSAPASPQSCSIWGSHTNW